jgi:hypothetical protein
MDVNSVSDVLQGRPWRWRKHLPPKRQQHFLNPHSAKTQKQNQQNSKMLLLLLKIIFELFKINDWVAVSLNAVRSTDEACRLEATTLPMWISSASEQIGGRKYCLQISVAFWQCHLYVTHRNPTRISSLVWVEFSMLNVKRIMRRSCYMRIEILMTEDIKITAFWDVMPCSLIDRNKYFGVSFCLQLNGRSWSRRQKFIPKCW